MKYTRNRIQKTILQLFVFSLFILSLFFFSCRGKKENHREASVPDTSNISESGISAADEQVLRDAAHDGDYEKVRRLLSKEVNPDAADENGRNALMFAAFNGHTDIVQMLLDAGAEIDARELFGRTALMYASTGPFPRTVELLLNHGADPNIIDTGEHFTALMHAAAEGQTEVVRILLNHGADPMCKDVDGDTAETFARNNGHTELADYLKTVMEKQ